MTTYQLVGSNRDWTGLAGPVPVVHQKPDHHHFQTNRQRRQPDE